MRAIFWFFLLGGTSLYAGAPVVSNISASQRANTRLVDITYDVAADFPAVAVSLQVSSDAGASFAVPATTLSGAIGAGVAPGTAKKITWDAGTDWSGQFSTQMRFRVIAEDGNTAPTISDIADLSVPSGSATSALSITLGDTQTPPSLLTLSGSSSNTTLVPNSGIVFGGSGANRTVTVTPAPGQSGPSTTITVTVSDGSLSASDTFVLAVNSAVPADFALITAGAFTTGDSLYNYGGSISRTMTLDAYYIGKYEVTKAEWDKVQSWALSNGYSDLTGGSGKASNHPVHSISWYKMVKWCNARSEKEGLTPAYYTDNAQTTIYKTGDVDVTNAQVKWTANGYRLPTDAEWEKAARGGLTGKRFPWGDTISQTEANYRTDILYPSFDMSAKAGGYNFHPTYYVGEMPYTAPVGSFAANGYGLYDMAGNVGERCWDWYPNERPASQSNPRGVTWGTDRIMRDGGWRSSANILTLTYAQGGFRPGGFDFEIGFRVVRGYIP